MSFLQPSKTSPLHPFPTPIQSACWKQDGWKYGPFVLPMICWLNLTTTIDYAQKWIYRIIKDHVYESLSRTLDSWSSIYSLSLDINRRWEIPIYSCCSFLEFDITPISYKNVIWKFRKKHSILWNSHSQSSFKRKNGLTV